jgi:anti-sigma regulatory factor (Ser/Thr protein kinase)
MVAFERQEHELRADLGRVKEARDFADLCALDFGFTGDERYQLKLSMSEAVTNAIQHGSSSEGDPIWLTAVGEGDTLVFYVRDTGRFIPHARRSGKLQESGRGLDFMRRLMDEVDLRPGRDGTLVRFSKRREESPGGGLSPPMQTVSD